MSMKNPAIVFLSSPTSGSALVPGEHLAYRDGAMIDLDNVALNGGILVRTVALGVDVFIRGRMLWGAFQVGSPAMGCGVGVVLRSEHKLYKPGDHVTSWDYPFQQYHVFAADTKGLEVAQEGLPWTTHLGALGLGGRTAWDGYKAFVNPEKEQTIYVNAAASLVGSVICQLAKLDGFKVIASAGSPEKVQYLLNDLGVDIAFDYKTEDTAAVLKEHAAGGVDLFWDNVGGKSLETTLFHMKKWGKVIICGFAAQWPDIAFTKPYGIPNSYMILANNLTVVGYRIDDLIERYGDKFDFKAGMRKVVEEGKVKVKEHVSTNMADIPRFLEDTMSGKLFGRAVVKLD